MLTADRPGSNKLPGVLFHGRPPEALTKESQVAFHSGVTVDLQAKVSWGKKAISRTTGSSSKVSKNALLHVRFPG